MILTVSLFVLLLGGGVWMTTVQGDTEPVLVRHTGSKSLHFRAIRQAICALDRPHASTCVRHRQRSALDASDCTDIPRRPCTCCACSACSLIRDGLQLSRTRPWASTG